MASSPLVAYYTAMKNFLVDDREMSVRDWLVDGGVALAAFAFGCMQLILSSSSILIADETFRQLIGVINTSPAPFSYIAMAITTVPLILRRQYSWPVFLFCMFSYLLMQHAFQGYSLTIIGPAVALFTIARERSRSEAISAAILAVAVVFFGMKPSQNEEMATFLRLQNASYLIVAALTGFAVRTYKEYVVEVEQRALEAERTREEEAARRVEEERVRIAREIHDITAHSLSAVSIQAAAAERLIEKDPAAAQEAIKTVRGTAKDALEEIRSMIGVLRQSGTQSELSPTSGTERMDDLVSYLEGAGIEVDYQLDAYDRDQVPGFIDIALFGIAREAVTNIVRHANAKHATIRLTLEPRWVRLLVEDDGTAAKGSEGTEGHGIQGMRERVNVLGGTLEAGGRDEGGFAVKVTMPLGEIGRIHE